MFFVKFLRRRATYAMILLEPNITHDTTSINTKHATNEPHVHYVMGPI
jgi:hypothetical protein